MMTDEERAYSIARTRFKTKHLDPAVELLETTNALVAKHKHDAEQARITLEVMRPVWAQGWTSVEQAASASSNALAGLWQILGVTDQTAAVTKLRDWKMALEIYETPKPVVETLDPQRLPSLEERARGTWCPGDDA